MRALITGATGFLGRAVTAAFIGAGHDVTVLARPAADAAWLGEQPVRVVRGDLRSATGLDDAWDGVDALVHLAADVSGDEHDQFASTVVGTERLLLAMSRTATRRLVLASSITVYDWRRVAGRLTEDSPLDDGLGDRGRYTAAKVWQERVSRRMSQEHGFQLTVLRPGIIWGAGDPHLSGVGRRVGPAQLVFGPSRQMPITYLENCADAFLAATSSPSAPGETFNVFDDERVTAWRYTGEHVQRTGTPCARIPVPYSAGLSAAGLARMTSRSLFGAWGKLPSILVPARFEADFKPVRFPNDKLRALLGWRPPYTFEQALHRAYGATVPAGRSAMAPRS